MAELNLNSGQGQKDWSTKAARVEEAIHEGWFQYFCAQRLLLQAQEQVCGTAAVW